MVIQRARGRTHRAAYHGPGPSCANAFIIFFPSPFLFDVAKDMFYLFLSEEGDGEDASEHGQKCGGFLVVFFGWFFFFFFFSSLPTAEPAASAVTQRAGCCCGVCKRHS